MERKILIIDDEWDSPVVRSVIRRLEQEGWQPVVVKAESADWNLGDEFEAEAIYSIEEQRPDAVILDVRFGGDREDQFKGIGILDRILRRDADLPVLMFTQYVQGPQREVAAKGALDSGARVDFIDKLASPEEVVLRLRRLIGTSPDLIAVGEQITIDRGAKVVFANIGGGPTPVQELVGMKFEILRELAESWYSSPGELVHFSRLERYSGGEDARGSLRVRIREIKDILGAALGVRFGAGDLIVNVRDQGYRLAPPRS